MIAASNTDPLFNIDATIDYLGGLVARGTLARWRCEGRGPRWVKVSGKRVAYRRSALDEFLAGQERTRTEENPLRAA